MPVEIKVPEMGESVIEATVARWLKNVGDPVSPGEPLVELETDKVNLEVGSQQAGILEGILKQPGETVLVGDVLARVSATGTSAPTKSRPAGQPHQEEAAAPQVQTPEMESEPQDAVPVTATPVAQRMAQDLGIDLARIKPGGSGGRITKEDVLAFSAKAPLPPQPGDSTSAGQPRSAGGKEERNAPAPAQQPTRNDTQLPPAAPLQQRSTTQSNNTRETRMRMSRRRQTIARRLVEAQHTAAMLTTFNEVDMSAVIDLRKRRRDGFKERFGVDLGFMSFFVKASIGALKAFPNVNAEIAASGDEIVLKSYYDIGIAIGAEEGLVVPVIRDADRLSFAVIEKTIRDYSAKVKASTLSLEDLRGGTFTITNGGVFGSLLSTPILNPPQVAILGMHKIQERPVALKGEIVIRPMMYLALSYDHRIIDGREAVQFLVRLKELIEDPEALLLG
jgi:2-oxoglutarate dehydrogenase E2 component (dihydrolipoamide succinyltransferase)